MTNERSIERVLDQWFAAGPSELPDRVLDAITADIDRTGQRPAWRLLGGQLAMNPTFRVAALLAAALAAALIGVALIGGGIGIGPKPSPTPEPAPTAPPLTQTFTSDLYGFSVRYPAAWDSVHNADHRWDGVVDATPPNMDEVGYGDFAGGFTVIAARIAPGQTADEWYNRWAAGLAKVPAAITCPGNGADRSHWRPITVAGIPAYTYDTCQSFLELVLVTRGRFYDIAMTPAVDRQPLFDAMLATMTFTDNAPVDRP